MKLTRQAPPVGFNRTTFQEYRPYCCASVRSELASPRRVVSRARRMLRAHVYCARRKEGRGKHNVWCIWTGFCVRCRNVGSTNQIVVSGNQHKQHLTITCSKCTLDRKSRRSRQGHKRRSNKSTAIVPARPCLLLTRLYRWQYPGPQVN